MSDASLFNTSEFESSPGEHAGIQAPLTTAGTHSLYRKYRPTSFADDDLVGQEHVVNTLRNAIALNRISHAYLFCGPRGTGKTTTARLLAKAVNCLDPDPQKRPCNACASCHAINANATTDVIEIDAASNRGIDDIRDLRERVKYAPTQLKTKFYIIDEAHQITGAAANAFLKTLEEPPAHTRFVLATTDPEELLPTIVSRCQRFDFRRIGIDAMVSNLRRIADLEGIRIDEDALPVIARQATGSLRDAQGMLDQVAMYRESATSTEEAISAETVRRVLGVSRNERVEAIARALADRDAAAGLREVSAAVDAGDDIRQLGRQLVSYLRLLLQQRAGGAADADETAHELAGRFTLEELAGLIRPMADLDFRARRSAIPELPLEIAIVEGAQRGSQPTRATAESSPRNVARAEHPHAEPPRMVAEAEPRTSLKDRVRGKPAPPTPFTPSAEAEPPATKPTPGPQPAAQSGAAADANTTGDLELERIVDLWPQIRADVKALNRRIEALLQQVDPAAVVGSKLVLVSPYEFHRNRVNSDDVRQVIEGVVGRLTGTRIQVSCVSRDEAQGMRGASHAPAALAEPEVRAVKPPDPATSNSVAEPEAPGSDGAGTQEFPNARDGMSEADRQARVQAARNIFDADEIAD